MGYKKKEQEAFPSSDKEVSTNNFQQRPKQIDVGVNTSNVKDFESNCLKPLFEGPAGKNTSKSSKNKTKIPKSREREREVIHA